MGNNLGGIGLSQIMQFFAQNFSQAWINFSIFFQTWVIVRTLVFEVFLLFVVVLLGLRCRKLLPVLFGSERIKSNISIFNSLTFQLST